MKRKYTSLEVEQTDKDNHNQPKKRRRTTSFIQMTLGGLRLNSSSSTTKPKGQKSKPRKKKIKTTTAIIKKKIKCILKRIYNRLSQSEMNDELKEELEEELLFDEKKEVDAIHANDDKFSKLGNTIFRAMGTLLDEMQLPISAKESDTVHATGNTMSANDFKKHLHKVHQDCIKISDDDKKYYCLDVCVPYHIDSDSDVCNYAYMHSYLANKHLQMSHNYRSCIETFKWSVTSTLFKDKSDKKENDTESESESESASSSSDDDTPIICKSKENENRNKNKSDKKENDTKSESESESDSSSDDGAPICPSRKK